MAHEYASPIVITGGTGFIASYLAMRLLEQNKDERVLLIDSNPDMRRLTGFKERYDRVKSRLTFVQGDITAREVILAIFDEDPKSVFHLAALLSAGADANPTFGFDVDLLGTRNVLEAARIHSHRRQKDGTPVPMQVMFASTIASFGEFITPEALVGNEDKQFPTTMYGVSKVASERLGEYYNRKKWVDFRAVRFPSVVGAGRGPGGTTVYSTLMIQQPALENPKPYEAYVAKETRLDVLYVEDAVSALIGLYNASNERLQQRKRRVYNIAGIRIDKKAPQASDIEAAVRRQNPKAEITYNPDKGLLEIVHTFGILDDSAARDDWSWPGAAYDLPKAVEAFFGDVKKYPGRIKAIELY